MELVRRIQQLHDDKVSGALLGFVKDGRAQEVLAAFPEIEKARPNLEEQLASVRDKAQKALSGQSNPTGFEPIKTDRCGHCGYPLLQYSKDSVVLICESCGTQSKGDGNYRHNIKIPDNPLLKLHATFNYMGAKWQVIGCQTYKGETREWDDEDDVWEKNAWQFASWWLINEKREIAWLDRDAEGYSWSYGTKVEGKPPKNDRSMEYGTYWLVSSAGEFSYFPRKKEMVKTFEKEDYSVEILHDENGKQVEIEAFRSKKISSLDLLVAFGRDEIVTQIKRFKLAILGVVASLLVLVLGSFVLSFFEKDLVSFVVDVGVTRGTVADGESTKAGGIDMKTLLNLDMKKYAEELRKSQEEWKKLLHQKSEKQPEKDRKVKRIPLATFTLEKTGLLNFQVSGGIPGDDGSFDAELVIEDVDQKIVAEIPFSLWRESGVDSDGRWTESQKSDASKVLLPAGENYQMSLAPDEMLKWKKVALQGVVRQNAISVLPIYLGGIALLLCGVWLFISRRQMIKRASGA